MKQAVRLLRAALYFPLDVGPKLGIPYKVAVWYLRQIDPADKVLRRSMLGRRA